MRSLNFFQNDSNIYEFLAGFHSGLFMSLANFNECEAHVWIAAFFVFCDSLAVEVRRVLMSNEAL